MSPLFSEGIELIAVCCGSGRPGAPDPHRAGPARRLAPDVRRTADTGTERATAETELMETLRSALAVAARGVG
ncbi:hypothetical protein [Streptomyces canus]|uniref:hypothetical protein n=1 Tax=Streptomyces canus TaxID=58343 RepID=UPI0030E553AC